MGKSLVIKGADFSVNGFTYQIDSLVVKNLYYKGTGQASLVKDVSTWPVSSSDGRAFVAATPPANTYSMSTSAQNSLVFKKYPIGDYTHVKVRTVAAVNARFIPLAFIDSDENLLGGFVIATPNSGDTIMTQVAVQEGFREFEMDVPNGTTHIIATFIDTSTGSNNPFSENGFAVTLSKISDD